MTVEAVFTREGQRFLPTPYASGPWGADRLHGGPVLGLIARAIEAVAHDPTLVLTRLTVDMFRSVPMAPLSVAVDPIREGSRLLLLSVSLVSEEQEQELVRATALLLRTNDALAAQRAALRSPPTGPDGLTTQSLMRGFPRDSAGYPPGFHTRVETRWVPRSVEQPLSIWFRWPIELVAGEQASPLVSAIALSDFANAVASISASQRDPGQAPYINADATLYLSRKPQGEWFCLQEAGCDIDRGVSTAETLLYDAHGQFGRALQARLANKMTR